MLSSLRYPRLWLSGAWLLVGIITVLSLTPLTELPKVPVSDKIEHMSAYVLLTVWFAGLYPRSRYLWICLLLFAQGVFIEWAQGAMDLGRQRDFLDVIANTAGIVVGVGLALLWLGNWAQRLEGLFGPTSVTRRS